MPALGDIIAERRGRGAGKPTEPRRPLVTVGAGRITGPRVVTAAVKEKLHGGVTERDAANA